MEPEADGGASRLQQLGDQPDNRLSSDLSGIRVITRRTA